MENRILNPLTTYTSKDILSGISAHIAFNLKKSSFNQVIVQVQKQINSRVFLQVVKLMEIK